VTLRAEARPVPDGAGRFASRPKRARRLIVVVAGLSLVLGLLGVAANVVLVARLERIEGAFAGLESRPAGGAGRTFLMVGTLPSGGGGADVPWLEGEQSVEAVMLVGIAPDGLSARVETLPRESDTRSAAGLTRPAELVARVERWANRRVDHLVAVDWTTFVQLAEHNGVDPTYTYGAEPSVQHDFLERVLEGALHQELRKHPLDLYRVLNTAVEGTAVDDGLSALQLNALVFSLRNLRSRHISFGVAQPG
jgi:hypothetical protein